MFNQLNPIRKIQKTMQSQGKKFPNNCLDLVHSIIITLYIKLGIQIKISLSLLIKYGVCNYISMFICNSQFQNSFSYHISMVFAIEIIYVSWRTISLVTERSTLGMAVFSISKAHCSFYIWNPIIFLALRKAWIKIQWNVAYHWKVPSQNNILDENIHTAPQWKWRKGSDSAIFAVQ